MKTIIDEQGKLVEVTESEPEELESGDEVDPVTGKMIVKKANKFKPRAERERIVNPYDERYVKERNVGFGEIEIKQFLRAWTKDQLKFFEMFQKNSIAKRSFQEK